LKVNELFRLTTQHPAMKIEHKMYALPPIGPTRVPWVDIAKGICIILVVMMHTTLGLGKDTGQTVWMHDLVEFARPFRMPDFFLISGLFLAATIDRPWRIYLDRKVVHFFYFYFLWLLIQFAFKAPFMAADGQSWGAIGRLLLFSFVQPFGTLWFIYMLPVFFVVTKLLKSAPRHLFALALVLQLISVDTTYLLSIMELHMGVVSIDTHWVLVDEFCSFYVYFLAGYLLAPRLFALAEFSRQNVSLSLTGLVLWGLGNLVLVANGYSTWPVISLVLAGAGALAIVTLAGVLTHVRIGAVLGYLGGHSLVVYLAFFIPMILARLALMRFFPWLDGGSMAALATAIAIVAPLVGFGLINKIGIGHFLFRRPTWAVLAQWPPARVNNVQSAQ